jgi:hypothetical protein
VIASDIHGNRWGDINDFPADVPVDIVEPMYRKHKAAVKIQRAWRNAYRFYKRKYVIDSGNMIYLAGLADFVSYDIVDMIMRKVVRMCLEDRFSRPMKM